jgi:hypothetical protein
MSEDNLISTNRIYIKSETKSCFKLSEASNIILIVCDRFVVKTYSFRFRFTNASNKKSLNELLEQYENVTKLTRSLMKPTDN